jgi:ribosomal protein L31
LPNNWRSLVSTNNGFYGVPYEGNNLIKVDLDRNIIQLVAKDTSNADYEIISENLIINGSFDSSEGWVLENNWIISDGSAYKSPSIDSSLYQNISLDPGDYKINFSLSVNSANTEFYAGSQKITEEIDSIGDFTYNFNISNSVNAITFLSNITTINNVELYKIQYYSDPSINYTLNKIKL